MWLNDKISEQYELTVDNSTHRIFSTLLDQQQKQTWYDFLLNEKINFKNIKIKKNRLEITRWPTMFNPLIANGKITFDFTDTENNQVIVRCNILPFDGIFPYLIGIHLLTFSLIVSACILIPWIHINELLFILLGWIVIVFTIYLGLLYTKYGLRKYSRRVVNELMTNEEARR